MTERQAALAAFLAAARTTPFVWGERDCALFAADWVRERTGRDGAATWRGRYRTALGCARILGREGGLLATFERGATSIGLEPADQPAPGDVGVILVTTRRGIAQAAAVRSCRRWITLGATGLVAGPAETLKAWRV